jgi:RNA methyltransferase, TrmH family
MRKCALLLGGLERELMERPEGLEEPGLESYLVELGALLEATESASKLVVELARGLVGSGDRLRAIDALRHALIAASGQAPADWDLIDPRTGALDSGQRRVHPGMKVYLEDLRSPFNVGSIFRTADAFGVDELILSPSTADPGHPRSQRSAMGAIELLPWRRAMLEGGQSPVFALELGGTPIEDFEFPERGLVVLGSEELGVSRAALELCTYGIVTIPMSGAKASLNVAVAFGILMQAWSASLEL